jgi:hypothetical protein
VTGKGPQLLNRVFLSWLYFLLVFYLVFFVIWFALILVQFGPVRAGADYFCNHAGAYFRAYFRAYFGPLLVCFVIMPALNFGRFMA